MLTPRIIIVVPTKGRPAQFARMAQSFAGQGMVTLNPHFNHDDLLLPEYKKILNEIDHYRFATFWGGKECGQPMWNQGATTSNDDLVLLASDDLVCRSASWYEQVCWAYTKAMADNPHGMFLIWGEDGSCGARHATHPFVPRALIRAMGKVMPHCCEHYEGDTFLMDVMRGAELKGYFLPDLLIEHCHVKYGKQEPDDLWKSLRDVQRRDWIAYRESGRGRQELEEAVARVNAAKLCGSTGTTNVPSAAESSSPVVKEPQHDAH